ncbi:hypothetical protein D9758_014798 [Tetrapyrgos nigripes]|uniref:Uncharacterized protein n=1 Tax=Tetrapyrgos nigripes TaxID=182062 RepID=A0A8H5C5H7_9AGAR|nr:hypothetical protein D9758_014798 [Tetrapyrgos nigripes]
MALDWQADKSRAYNHLQRIGIPTGKPKHRGHRHTQSLTQLSNLSPIPSLSSIATATSTTLNTPTSTSSISVFQPKEEDLTPTPSPKTSRVRTPTTPLSKGKPLGRSDSLKSIASLSTAGSSLIRRLSLKSSASRSEALKTPPPRAQLVKPQSVTAHTPMASTSTCTQRASSFDSERIGVRSGGTPNAYVDRDAGGAYNHHHSSRSSSKPKRRQHSESMPSTPLRNHSYSSTSTSASKPSSSRPTHKSTQPPAVPTPVRPPSRSEHLLRTTLLKDDFALANNPNSITANDNTRPTTPTSSSSSHRRSQSHSSSNRSTSTSRRDSELIASSFLFRTNVSSATLPPPSSPAIAKPTPRRSATSISTPTPARTTKPLFGFMVDSSDDGDDDSSQGSGPYTYTQQPQQRRNQHQPGIMHSPWDVDEYRQHRETRHTHAPAQRPDGYTHGRSQSYTQLPPAPRPPLTPHEQVLRARLERVLSAGNETVTSKGKGRELDWDGEEERFEDYIGNVGLADRGDGRRKRSSLPVTARDQEREREGSISGLFLGWLWRGGPAETEQSIEQESPQSYTQEGNPQLPTPLTPRESKDGYMSQTYSPYHSPGRSRSHTAPAPSSPSQSRFLANNYNNNPTLSQSQSPKLSSSPSIAAAAFVHLSPNANGNVNTTGTPRGTPKRHVFCLESVPSVGALRERAEEDEAAAAKANVNNDGDKGGNMITPPPTPPRKDKEFVPDGLGNGEGEATPKKVASRRGSSSSAMTAKTTTFGGAALGRSKSARTAPNTPMSKAGRVDLGLGRPAGLSRHGSSRDDICVLLNSPSMQIPKSPGRMISPTKASFGFSSPTGPTSAIDPTTSTVSPASADANASLSPASLSPVNSPVSSLLSNTSSFNARTASAQCRLMDGYVSFASIEGLGEPPASAHPSVGDGHSMLGDEDGDDKEREGGGKRFLGWILGK